MRNYETTFIVDPVLSTEDIKSTAQAYVDGLQKEGCEIVFVDEMGLRTLAGFELENLACKGLADAACMSDLSVEE